MSTEASDSRGSHCSGAPPSVTKKKIEKPPFHLYFARDQPPGRSDFRTSKLDAKYITPKFYSRGSDKVEQNNESSVELPDKIGINLNENKNCTNRNRLPLLSSQSYGWWYDRHLNSIDSRFNFHKNTSDMVHSNLMIQWEDKKLRNICH